MESPLDRVLQRSGSSNWRRCGFLTPLTILALSGLAAACSNSSTPAKLIDAARLKVDAAGSKPPEAGPRIDGRRIDGSSGKPEAATADAGKNCKPVSALYTFADVQNMIFNASGCSGCH